MASDAGALPAGIADGQMEPPAHLPCDQSAVLRLLVVDDSRLQRRLVINTLKGTNLVVEEATSAGAALEICREAPPDIILCDWMMPGMNGIELCGAIRDLNLERYVYIIMLTSKTEMAALRRALIEGADDFLAKPFDPDELHGRLIAARRIVSVERELGEKNRLVGRTLEGMREMSVLLERDLAEARKLQMSLVPRDEVICGPLRFTFLLRPSAHVGGDLVGWYPVGEGRAGLFSIDVSGHGIAAALIAARLAAWLSGGSPEQNIALTSGEAGMQMLPPTEVCGRMNRLFIDEIETGHYFTAIVALADGTTSRLELAQAGHPCPILHRASGEVELVGQSGMPVGLLPDAEFGGYGIDLAPGDRCLIYTDGLTECPLRDGTALGEDGLVRTLLEHPHLHGRELLSKIEREICDAAEGGAPPDDISAILVEHVG